MGIRHLASAACLAALTASAIGCGGIVDPAKNAVETFSGVVPVGGQADPAHTFSVGKTGEFFITITALTPDSNVYLGIALGQQTSGGCAPTGYVNNFAQLNRQALAGQIDKASYCVAVYDSNSGTVKQPANYTIRVSHP